LQRPGAAGTTVAHAAIEALRSLVAMVGNDCRPRTAKVFCRALAAAPRALEAFAAELAPLSSAPPPRPAKAAAFYQTAARAGSMAGVALGVALSAPGGADPADARVIARALLPAAFGPLRGTAGLVRLGPDFVVHDSLLRAAEELVKAAGHDRDVAAAVLSAHPGLRRDMDCLLKAYECKRPMRGAPRPAASAAAQTSTQEALLGIDSWLRWAEAPDQPAGPARLVKAPASGAGEAATGSPMQQRVPGSPAAAAPPTPVPAAAASAPAAPAAPAACANCGKTDAARLRLCRGCRLVRFCSQECMRQQWTSAGHKPACKAAQAAAAAKAAVKPAAQDVAAERDAAQGAGQQ
jgi:hypothetical protein